MQTKVRTTIILPEELLKNAKFTAVHEGKPLSKIIREALEDRLMSKNKLPTQDPMKLLGKYSLGIKKLYNKRSDLYEEHLKDKGMHMKLGKYSFGIKGTFRRKDMYADYLKHKVPA